MILGLLTGITVTLLTGYFAVSVIEREMALRFRILFSIPLGFGIGSVLYFLCLVLNLPSFQYYWILECIITMVLALFYYNEEKPDFSKHKFYKLSNWFYVLNVLALTIYLKYFLNNPMGSWDGFRIWNIKAEFLTGFNEDWLNVFMLPHFMSHNDYPMMLPASTARLWDYTGGENYLVNLVIGLFFTFGLVYLLYQSVEYFKSKKVALVVASVFMMLDIFLVNGASQCADIPLAYMFLSCIVCLFLYFQKQKFSYIILATMFATLSALTKNEGMMFLLIYLVVVSVWLLYSQKIKKLLIMLAVLAPMLVGLVLFKKIAHSPNDLIMGFFYLKTYNFVFDLSRYIVITKTFLSMLFFKFTLLLSLVLICFKGFRLKTKYKTPFMLSVVISALCVSGYFMVYLFSPHDIGWLVKNSMDRIILQILPVCLLLFSVNLRIGKPDSNN